VLRADCSYQERVPEVNTILEGMVANSIVPAREAIENDHIAFRTMGVPQLGISSFEKIFLSCGYQKRDFYQFEQKKLDAYWYSPPENHYPRIFISELRVEELSDEAQRIVTSYTKEVKRDPVLDLALDDARAVTEYLHKPLWRTPTWEGK